MKSESKYRERVWKYLQADISTEEKLRFEDELLMNPRLLDLYKEELNIYESLRKSNVIELRKQLQHIISNFPSNGSRLHHLMKYRKWFYAAASVAAILFISLIILLFTGVNRPQIQELVTNTQTQDSNIIDSETDLPELRENPGIYYRSIPIRDVEDTAHFKDFQSLLLTISCEENPMLENRITLTYRNDGFEILSPKIGQEFKVGEKIPFDCRTGLTENLTIQILNNRAVTMFNETFKGHTFVLGEPLSIGLYYWRLKAGDTVLYNGKYYIK
jgi:hypothetical protein